ncbi:hypothetical protein EV644_101802 [Kribbella orskensis]|uniref:Lipoprotein n=1 Tax=Kribbella orskensis TaxID=2512216 RepID=A0ABY2BVR5_9ACTN|nr:hypothetical protein EV642_101187 [Kribbella sp. VKM Ac-2500]TCO32159.1 hypothetical protein EV644_101802 [Kribbella orskensis]
MFTLVWWALALTPWTGGGIVRRHAPGVAAVLYVGVLGVGVLGLTGCGGNAGGTTTQVQVAPAAPTAAPKAVPSSSLAPLVVVPGGYLKGSAADPEQLSGPFTAELYLDTLSPMPAVDRALLLNASFTEGYQVFRVSPDRQKRFTLQLFRTGSRAKAADLRQGFWKQDVHSHSFAVPGVPGALTDARVEVVGSSDQMEAVAQTTFVVGTLVVDLTIRQTGSLQNTPIPDTALITTLAKQQKDRLSRKSG